MSQYKKSKASTSTRQPENQICTGCPRASDYSSSTSNGDGSSNNVIDLLSKTLVNIDNMKKDIDALQDELDKSKDFIKSTTKLSNVSRGILIFLIIVPVLQLIFCAAVVYHLGIQEDLPGLLNWVLSGVSLFSLAEIIYIPIKIFLIEKRIDDIKNKMDELSN